MRRIASMGFAVIAVLAFSATAATAKTPPITGHAPFHATSGLAKLSTTGLPEIECKSSSAVGQLTSATKGEATITFRECATEGKKCGNVEAGTIETKLLETTVGWINKAKGEAGVDFIGKVGGEKTKGAEVEFECEGLAVEVKGSAIGRSTPANTMTTEGKVVLVGKNGQQEVESFEGMPKDTLITEASAIPGVEAPSAQNQTGAEKFDEVEVPKGKKIVKVADPVELNLVNNPATPEQGRCQKTKHAKYTDANCTIVAAEKNGVKKGKFEFVPIS